MKGLFQELLKQESVRSVMVLDDDVVFACNFRSTLREGRLCALGVSFALVLKLFEWTVMQQGRCGGVTARSSDLGGVMLLGSAIWIDGTYPSVGLVDMMSL
jgi:hypothetical protein